MVDSFLLYETKIAHNKQVACAFFTQIITSRDNSNDICQSKRSNAQMSSEKETQQEANTI